MESPETPERPDSSLVLVTGLTRERDFFLGEPVSGSGHELLGKVLSATDGMQFLVRPFRTLLDLERSPAKLAVHPILDPGVEAEARRLLSGSATHVAEADAPLLHEWLRLARAPAGGDGEETVLGFVLGGGDSVGERLATIQRTSRAFRDLLLSSPHLRSERELDRVLELDADLTLELGKVVHRLARRLAQLVRDIPELRSLLDPAEAAAAASLASSEEVARSIGWDALWARLQAGLASARAQGRMALLEDLNALVREGLATLHGVLSDHASALDTLVAEGLAEYGLEGSLEPVPRPDGACPSPRLPVFPRLHALQTLDRTTP